MFNPYAEQSPYEILGVSPQATAAEIRDRHTELKRQIQESGDSPGERAKRIKDIQDAYDKLRVAGQRVRVDFTILSSDIGLKQCETAAQSVATPNTNVEGLVKPRTVRVSHSIVLNEPARLVADPPKVSGLYPRPLEFAQAPRLPAALEVAFDC